MKRRSNNPQLALPLRGAASVPIRPRAIRWHMRQALSDGTLDFAGGVDRLTHKGFSLTRYLELQALAGELRGRQSAAVRERKYAGDKIAAVRFAASPGGARFYRQVEEIGAQLAREASALCA